VPVAMGTRNLSREPAMTPDQLVAALNAGIDTFARIREEHDPQIVALGDMGIGNTTTAATMICAFTGAAPEDVVGRGTGVDDEGLRRKLAVVSAAADRLKDASWANIGAEAGGFEIAGLTGVLLAAAKARVPILLDGFIVAASALLARAIAPTSIEYCIAAHRSREAGHAIALRALGLVPLFDLDLRLGEGSGAALAFPLCEAAARMYSEMKTFAEAGVSEAHVTVGA
jgi:nicotinate-nucleotide--dimethylbenzimidazole phosphoribosyltransferase